MPTSPNPKPPKFSTKARGIDGNSRSASLSRTKEYAKVVAREERRAGRRGMDTKAYSSASSIGKTEGRRSVTSVGARKAPKRMTTQNRKARGRKA